ncbi:MAG: outer membrane lipoprotein LolB [Proteobacteria bacterium]|nr:outer membrane lipoprotein LolB [Pseudomonadota bacterium]
MLFLCGANRNRFYLRVRCYFLILFLLLVSGCASRLGALPLEDEKQSLFEIYVKVIVRRPQQPSQRFFALWHRQITTEGGVFDEIELKVLGTTYAKLSSGTEGAVLEYKAEIVKAKNVDELGVHFFGEPIPFNAFGYWLNGVSSPLATTKEEKQADGKMKTIKQFGWEIEYLEYDSEQQPRKIAISTTSGLMMNIDIKQWWNP